LSILIPELSSPFVTVNVSVVLTTFAFAPFTWIPLFFIPPLITNCEEVVFVVPFLVNIPILSLL